MEYFLMLIFLLMFELCVYVVNDLVYLYLLYGVVNLLFDFFLMLIERF